MVSMTDRRCAVCNGPATMYCPHCANGLDMDGCRLQPSHYCSERCQASDLDHQSTCKQAVDRKQLYRAGQFVQAHFEQYSRSCFQLPIDVVGSIVDGSKIKVYLSRHKDHRVFFNFFNHLFANENDHKAMLAWSQCDHSMLRMRELVRLCLEGKS